MAVTVPSTDKKNSDKAVSVTAITASLAIVTSTAHKPALSAALDQAQRELVDSLMASGKVSAAAFLAAASYNT